MENYYIFDSPIGRLKLCEENEKITSLSLSAKDSEAASVPDGKCPSALLCEAYKQLNEYFTGKRKVFDLPLHYMGTPFQQQVWKELQRIPYGETRSYEDIAVGIKNPKAVRAVGQANNKNPIMIIIPCHRVIHKSGGITGFGCGTEIKKYLLDLEKAGKPPIK